MDLSILLAAVPAVEAMWTSVYLICTQKAFLIPLAILINFLAVFVFVKALDRALLPQRIEKFLERRVSKKNIDLTFLRDMAEGSEDFIKEMIEEFIKQTPIIIDDMNKYLMDKNWDSLNETAHKLKPGIDFMGIHSIKEVIINLEKNAAKQTNLQNLPSLMAKITDICTKAIEDLKNMTISKNDK